MNAFDKQRLWAALGFITEIGAFVALIWAVMTTKSMIVIIDVIDSSTVIIGFAFTFIMSGILKKDLSSDFNYGSGKIAALGSLITDILVTIAILTTLVSVVINFNSPVEKVEGLLGACAIKTWYVISDYIGYTARKKIYLEEKNRLFESEVMNMKKELMFDSVGLVALIVITLLNGNQIGNYIQSIVSIILVIYVLYNTVNHIKESTGELMDKSSDYKRKTAFRQMLIRFYGRYKEVVAVRSRQSGDKIYVEYNLSFEQNTTYDEIEQLSKDLQHDLSELIGECEVSVVVANKSEIAREDAYGVV
ncbi:MAG: cation transporter [Lachnospiraceae bacterium]|nr:cation transporter [Lachnospiraceae bacterium]